MQKRQGESEYSIRVIEKSTKNELIVGTFDDPHSEGHSHDPNVGHYVTLDCKTEKGFSLMSQWYKEDGFRAFIPHDRKEKEIHPGCKVVSITGNGDDGGDLATRFLLLKDDEEVA